jgi:hypothetical protein
VSGAYAALAADGYWIRALSTLAARSGCRAGVVPEPPPTLARVNDYSLLTVTTGPSALHHCLSFQAVFAGGFAASRRRTWQWRS